MGVKLQTKEIQDSAGVSSTTLRCLSLIVFILCHTVTMLTILSSIVRYSGARVFWCVTAEESQEGGAERNETRRRRATAKHHRPVTAYLHGPPGQTQRQRAGPASPQTAGPTAATSDGFDDVELHNYQPGDHATPEVHRRVIIGATCMYVTVLTDCHHCFLKVEFAICFLNA